jgi:hypothetical protein
MFVVIQKAEVGKFLKMKIGGEGGGANPERVAYVPLCMSMSVMVVSVSV